MAAATVRRSTSSALPPVCCVCGTTATQARSETFTWTPQWVFLLVFFGVLPWVVAAMFARRTAALTLPVCDRHVRRSRRAWWILAVGLLLAVGAGFASDFAPAAIQTDIVAGAFLFGLFVLVVAVGLADDRVRPKHIDDRSVTLDRVSDGFAAAVADAGREPPRRAPAGGGMELATARYYRE